MANAPISRRTTGPRAPQGTPPTTPSTPPALPGPTPIRALLRIPVYSHEEDIPEKGAAIRGVILLGVDLHTVPHKDDVLGMLSMRDDKKLDFDTLVNDMFDPNTITEPELHVVTVERVISTRGFEKEIADEYKVLVDICNMTERPKRLAKDPTKPAGDAVEEDMMKLFPGAKKVR